MPMLETENIDEFERFKIIKNIRMKLKQKKAGFSWSNGCDFKISIW